MAAAHAGAAFARWDSSGDGCIDREELVAVLKNLGAEWTDEMIECILSRIGSDERGRLRYEDFCRFLLSGKPDAGVQRKSPRLFVGANWKCSLSTAEQVDSLLAALAQRWPVEGPSEVELCVFPPYVFLDRARKRLSKEIQVGSQNAWDASEGFACTGVVASAMLKAVGCGWVLLGHSDRRNVLGETDALIAEKVKRCLEAGLNVNLTIGEKLEARQAGDELKVLQGQLAAAAEGVPPNAWHRVAVAYEPVWAVGEGATPCSPDETQRVHSALRAWLRDKAGNDAAQACRFLYTGSVNEKNAEQYAVLPDVDGFVVGRAGLDVAKLASICETLASCKRTAAAVMGA